MGATRSAKFKSSIHEYMYIQAKNSFNQTLVTKETKSLTIDIASLMQNKKWI